MEVQISNKATDKKDFDSYLNKTISNLKRLFNTKKLDINFRKISKYKHRASIRVTAGNYSLIAQGFGNDEIAALADARKNIRAKFHQLKGIKVNKNEIKKFKETKNSKQKYYDDWLDSEMADDLYGWDFVEYDRVI